MSFLSFLGLGSPSPAVIAEPIAIVRPADHRAAAVQTVKAAAIQQCDPLKAASLAYENARRKGACAEGAMAKAFEALACSDFSSLQLNGPHTRAGDRVNTKALKKVQRVFMRLAETGPIF